MSRIASSFGTIRQTSWDWRAAGNFMFGGAGGALVFIAAVSSFPDSPPQALGLIALALVGSGLFSVWLEIGRPWRFLHVFFHPQTSWMTREASVAVVLFALTLIGIAFKITFMMWIAGVAGLLFVFCQGQMLKASKGIPAWREPGIVLLIVVTGICEGTAIMMLFLTLRHEASMTLHLLCLVLLAVRIASWLMYRNNLRDARVPKETLSRLERIHLVQVIAGNVIPAFLIILSLYLPGFATAAVVAAGVLILVTGWHMKFIIITRAARVQGYKLGKVRRGRPKIRPPVRRNPDRFVF